MASPAQTEALADPGPRPELCWLPLDILVVDARYQRDADRKESRAIFRRIAEGFDWRKFQPPTVTPIGDGRFAVLDGQHRVGGAKLRPDIPEVPCYVVTAPELRDQAQAFVAVNRDRVQVNPYHLHHAQVVARDPDAVHLQEVCDRAGVKIPRYPMPKNDIPPRHTLAIKAITKALSLYGDPPVVKALQLTADAFEDNPGQLRADVILAVIQLLVLNKGRTIDERRLKEAISSRLAEEWIEAGRGYRKLFGGSSPGAICVALVREYNGRLPTEKRLVESAAPAQAVAA